MNATPRKTSADICLPWSSDEHAARLDPEPLLGLARLVGVELGRHQVQADLAAAPRRVFLEQAQQVGLGLDELARDLRAVIRLDEHRPVGGDLLDQVERLARERVQLLRAGVGADAQLVDDAR